MKIETIRLWNFRNYQELVIHPHPGVNLFFGPNGSGKTNILEAIHYCALGKSHRVSGDQNVIRSGESAARCSLTVRTQAGAREITVQLTPHLTPKKVILIDQKKIRRFSDMMGCLQNVIFSPEDLDMVREGPSLRRRYLDMMISQVSTKYFIALQQYKAGMDQRNILLKTLRISPSAGLGMIADFEKAMAQPAAVIVEERRKMTELLSPVITETYEHISGQAQEKFRIEYHTSFQPDDDVAERMIRLLEENRETDIRLGVTTAGPHRDDLNLSLNHKNIKLYASQGQIRTAALSMKLAQMKLLRQLSGEPPVLLLDDVMSELDRGRRLRLISEIADYQTFITCTDASDLEFDQSKRVYQVASQDGIGRAVETAAGSETPSENLSEPDFSLPEGELFHMKQSQESGEVSSPSPEL